MTRCRHLLLASVLVTTAPFVVPLRADDDRSRYTIALSSREPIAGWRARHDRSRWIASKAPRLQAAETEELAMRAATVGWPRDTEQP